MTIFLWVLGLHLLFGLIAGEYIIHEVQTKPKPSSISDSEHEMLIKAMGNRPTRVGVRLVCMLLGYIVFIFVALSGLIGLVRKKRS